MDSSECKHKPWRWRKIQIPVKENVSFTTGRLEIACMGPAAQCQSEEDSTTNLWGIFVNNIDTVMEMRSYYQLE